MRPCGTSTYSLLPAVSATQCYVFRRNAQYERPWVLRVFSSSVQWMACCVISWREPRHQSSPSAPCGTVDFSINGGDVLKDQRFRRPPRSTVMRRPPLPAATCALTRHTRRATA